MSTNFQSVLVQLTSQFVSSPISIKSVKKGTPGFTLGQKVEGKLGMRASMTAELVFTDMEVQRYFIKMNHWSSMLLTHLLHHLTYSFVELYGR